MDVEHSNSESELDARQLQAVRALEALEGQLIFAIHGNRFEHAKTIVEYIEGQRVKMGLARQRAEPPAPLQPEYFI